MYKSNYKGYVITCEIVTPIRHKKFGKEKRVFYADNFKDMFENLNDLKEFIDKHIEKLQELNDTNVGKMEGDGE
jgi:hypothetical protein